MEECGLITEDRQIVFNMETLVTVTQIFVMITTLDREDSACIQGAAQDGREIAVKLLSLSSLKRRREFMIKVKLVAKIQHEIL